MVQQALERGHEVTAIVRNTEKLKTFETNPKFKVVSANLLDPNELVPHLTGQEVCLSGLGVNGIQISQITFYSESIKSITEAMNKAGVKRLICMTSFYTKRMDLF